MSGVHILWFRNDLRVHDHAPLRAVCLAAARDGGRVVPLFISEPDARHSSFLTESLNDLDAALEQRGASLHFRSGDPVAVLSELHRMENVLSVYRHEAVVPEPCDAQVEAWCMRAGVALRTFSQFGPEQTPSPGGSQAAAWDAFMATPRHEAPAELPAAQIGIGHRPIAQTRSEGSTSHLSGGRKAAIELLKHLLGPVSDLSQVAASETLVQNAYFDQLAPYLNFGVISIKETWQAAVTARNQYLSAGQDIRAARVTELIRGLPNFYHMRTRRAPTPGPSPRAGGRSEQGQQLSLDLGQTGTD